MPNSKVMLKAEILAQMRKAFTERFGRDMDYRERGKFEVDLDRLIYSAFAVAQEPYIRQFHALEDNLAKTNLLSTKDTTLR